MSRWRTIPILIAALAILLTGPAVSRVRFDDTGSCCQANSCCCRTAEGGGCCGSAGSTASIVAPCSCGAHGGAVVASSGGHPWHLPPAESGLVLADGPHQHHGAPLSEPSVAVRSPDPPVPRRIA